jgi:hypothetical protein
LGHWSTAIHWAERAIREAEKLPDPWNRCNVAVNSLEPGFHQRPFFRDFWESGAAASLSGL